MSDPNPSRYPYLTVRFMACVYLRRELVFGGVEAKNPGDVEVDIDPPADPLHLTPGERAAVLNAALRECVRTRWRRCVRFGPEDWVYVEPDGSTDSTSPPPSGGLGAFL
jgi:hypothetical protein